MATLVTPLRISVRSRMERARAGPSLRPGQATIWQFMWMPASARRRMMSMDFPAFRLPISSTRSSGSVVWTETLMGEICILMIRRISSSVVLVRVT